MNLKRAWRERPGWHRAGGECTPPVRNFFYSLNNTAWEWRVWFDQEVLGHSYDVEFIANGRSLGADYQLSKKDALEAARLFSYADSWALLAAKVTNVEGKVILDTTVRQPTAQELRDHASFYKEHDGHELEYAALMEYADRVEKESRNDEQA